MSDANGFALMTDQGYSKGVNEAETTEAILLRTYEFSETSLIVHWFSRDYGLIKTVIKGATGPRSRYKGMLEAFTVADVSFQPPRGDSDLSKLIDLELVRQYSGLGSSYHRLLVASYLGALVGHWLEGAQEERGIYDLLGRALGYVNEKTIEWRAVTYFEKQLASELGYGTNQAVLQQSASAKLTQLRIKVRESIAQKSGR